MVHYTFRTRQGPHSSDVPVDLPDDDAAWDEAVGACSDMIRDTIARLGEKSRTGRAPSAIFFGLPLRASIARAASVGGLFQPPSSGRAQRGTKPPPSA